MIKQKNVFKKILFIVCISSHIATTIISSKEPCDSALHTTVQDKSTPVLVRSSHKTKAPHFNTMQKIILGSLATVLILGTGYLYLQRTKPNNGESGALKQTGSGLQPVVNNKGKSEKGQEKDEEIDLDSVRALITQAKSYHKAYRDGKTKLYVDEEAAKRHLKDIDNAYKAYDAVFKSHGVGDYDQLRRDIEEACKKLKTWDLSMLNRDECA